ncbi:hypothetical protein [Bradyrhizobium sp. SZCCHNRI1073]|uniref:hypothetical protein n=1 Tax=Bradyrhizobium sp. SZCCHNRI1073 TaxID=3057280 RepID=UPI002916B0BF|nr:hypothetical protein [Bradyrhizobium sp. SZCCHNRI1073]
MHPARRSRACIRTVVAELRLAAAGVVASSAAKPFMFAEDRLSELAGLLGIPHANTLDSYRYLANGEGASGVLTLIGPDGETEIRLP